MYNLNIAQTEEIFGWAENSEPKIEKAVVNVSPGSMMSILNSRKNKSSKKTENPKKLENFQEDSIDAPFRAVFIRSFNR